MTAGIPLPPAQVQQILTRLPERAAAKARARVAAMTAASLTVVYCNACGLPGSELAAAETALAARGQLAGRGWAVNVREPTADRRLDFCPVHKGGRLP